ncbi:hypothetical protein GCM10020254_69230 [Streptomyces goshikiensis]
MRITGDGTTGGASPYGVRLGRTRCAAVRARRAVSRSRRQWLRRAANRHPSRSATGGPTACAAAGITYRQLDYWARTGLVEPSVRPAYGSGTQRLYSFRDVVVLKIVKRFLDTGVALQNIRTAVQHLHDRDFADLERMTLMSDGATVYECTSSDQVVSLLQGGQGIFGIAVGVVWRDVEKALSQLHGERVDTGETVVGHNPTDELAARRNRAV